MRLLDAIRSMHRRWKIKRPGGSGPTPPSSAETCTPTLPLAEVDTTMPTQTGATHTVNAGGNIQDAIDDAEFGDTIVIEAGATFTGRFELPVKSGTGWIVIKSSALGSLPAEGTRVGPSDAANMPRINANGIEPAFFTVGAAHHYRFVGIHFSGVNLVPPAGNGGLVVLDGAYDTGYVHTGAMTSESQLPHHLVFDRCYFHAPAEEYQKCMVWNSSYTAMIDSYADDFRSKTSLGGEVQVINAWNTIGVFKIVNNFLEASTENLMFGGSRADIPNANPNDITIQRNHFFKRQTWNPDHGSFGGTVYTVKNHLEFKQGSRALIEGNIFENHWASNEGGQSGYFFQQSPRNEGVTPPTNTWTRTNDITFRHNHIKNVTAGWAISGGDGTPDPIQTDMTNRVLITNNLVEDIGLYTDTGADRGVILACNNSPKCVTFTHNTIIGDFSNLPLKMLGTVATYGLTTPLRLQDNIFYGGNSIIAASDVPATGIAALDAKCGATGWLFDHNVLFGPYPNDDGYSPSFPADQFPPGNPVPDDPATDVGFVDYAGGPSDYHNYALSGASPYHNAASDGTDPGVNMTTLDAALP